VRRREPSGQHDGVRQVPLHRAVGHSERRTDLRRHRSQRDVPHLRRPRRIVLRPRDLDRSREHLGLAAVQGSDAAADLDEFIQHRVNGGSSRSPGMQCGVRHGPILLGGSDIAQRQIPGQGHFCG